jgi:hypothetical protein
MLKMTTAKTRDSTDNASLPEPPEEVKVSARGESLTSPSTTKSTKRIQQLEEQRVALQGSVPSSIVQRLVKDADDGPVFSHTIGMF